MSAAVVVVVQHDRWCGWCGDDGSVLVVFVSMLVLVLLFTVSILGAPSQVGQTLRNLGQKPYLPIYTLRQQ
jgi:hypothetical protein